MDGPDPKKMSPAMRADYERMQREMRQQEMEDAELPLSGEAQFTGVYDETQPYPWPHVSDEANDPAA